MSPLEPRHYRIAGSVAFDAARASLHVGGQVHHLRPKALAVLRHLVENAHRVVPKDELLRDIWQGAAVTEDTLTQCVSDLRKLLGDDPRNPRFIRTVPKQGFLFVAPIEEVREAQASATAPVHSAAPALPEARSRSWVAALVFACLAATAALAWAWTNRRPVPADSRIPVAFASFDNRTGRSDLDWMREGLPDMLMGSLAKSPRLSLIPRERASQARARFQISGAYAALGEAIRIEVRIHDLEDPRLIGSEILTVDKPDEVLIRFDGLAVRTAEALQVPLPSSHSGAAAEARTANVDAYRLYVLGVEQAQNFHHTEAIALFQRALELDPNFHMAHARIGYAHAFSEGHGAAGLPYLKKALQRSAAMNPRDRLFVEAWHAFAAQDFAGAIGIYRSIVKEYPEEVPAYAALARLLRGEKRLPEARDILLQAVAIDPEFADAHNLLGGIQFALGQKDQALASVTRYADLKPNEANAHDSLGVVYHRMGRYREAIESFRQALALKPGFDIPMIHLGNTLVHLGRYREAIAEYRRFEAATKSEAQRGRGSDSASWVLWKSGDANGALRESPGPPALRLAIQSDLPKGDAVPLKYAADTSWVNKGRGVRLSRRFETALLGHAALRSGESGRALALMKDALEQVPEYYLQTESEECLADAYLFLGRIDEAIAEYRRVLGLHPNLAVARYGLGVALAKRGDGGGSKAELRRFLEIWKDADRDLPQYRDAVHRLK
ncbi:MAG: tetratricopeptide repeat protein [Bryobacteraceae bacterium]